MGWPPQSQSPIRQGDQRQSSLLGHSLCQKRLGSPQPVKYRWKTGGKHVENYEKGQFRPQVFLVLPIFQRVTLSQRCKRWHTHASPPRCAIVGETDTCVTVNTMGSGHSRMHHHVKWRYAVPLILSDKWRKGERDGEAEVEQGTAEEGR